MAFDTSRTVNRLRLVKDSNGGGGQNVKDLRIEYTAEEGPLESRRWQPVFDMVNGFQGTELMNATAVGRDGTVTGDVHTGALPASLTFADVTATGLRIAFRNPNSAGTCSSNPTGPCNHYRVAELEVHFGGNEPPRCSGQAATIFAEPGIPAPLFGTPGRDVIVGSGDNDQIFGRGGPDLIRGGAGNDLINGNAGEDDIQGEAGDDTIRGGDDGSTDLLLGGPGADRIFGGPGADRMAGGSGDDGLSGGPGGDRLVGGRDEDKLFGGAGEDLLSGGPDRDVLFGGSDNDTLSGGSGRDRGSGDAGANVCVGIEILFGC